MDSHFNFSALFIPGVPVCNAALDKPAYQVSESDTAGGPYVAILAVDGNNMADVGPGSCAVTGVATNPWWVVDLGKLVPITYVQLTAGKSAVLIITNINF